MAKNIKIKIEFELNKKDYKSYEYVLNDFELSMGELGYDIEITENDEV